MSDNLLRDKFEALRGETIEVYNGNPLDVPCIETSDNERLYKAPVVSVMMLTYNHEPYIRQAIEGVVAQKTDFEFELIIGEDCSTDKTREICFEYQRKYPDKIRVLWADVNVQKLGGNGRRCLARCRGEFIALCEGDDYWIDSYKLQKQVDVMRSDKGISLCFADADVYYQGRDLQKSCHGVLKRWGRDGKISGRDLIRSGYNPVTCTLMLRRSAYERAEKNWEIFSWHLNVGDVTLITAISLLGDVWCSTDVMAVYRIHSRGAMRKYPERVYIDSALVRLYFISVIGSELYPVGHARRMQIQVCRSRALLNCQLGFRARQEAMSNISALGVLSWYELVIARLGRVYRGYNYVRQKKDNVLTRIRRLLKRG